MMISQPGHMNVPGRLRKHWIVVFSLVVIVLGFANIHSPGNISEKIPTCRLDPNKPQPYILMSRGRSGSSNTWQVIGNLTGRETKVVEYPATNQPDLLEFYEQWEKQHPSRRGEWVLDMLCRRQRESEDAGVIGFKLKPLAPTHPEFHAALDIVASAQSPPIKVVRLRRNPLDVLISKAKHTSSVRENEKMKAHCRIGDSKCIDEHLKFGTGIKLNITSVTKELEKIGIEENEVDDLLNAKGIRHVSVSYEKLYYAGTDDVSEWSKIVDFLVGYSTKNLTKEMVQKANTFAPTSTRNHSIEIDNFEEIKAVLGNIGLSHLLH